MHGGDMGIESELGVGSFFFFKLPIPKAAGSAPPAPPAPTMSHQVAPPPPTQP